ncbi:hypothetical protein BC937DRAFT_87115 [Endogone sp. FLAS-F59071]|nr:hypothetical protein BC937DRAFT_87115 [Endogone sp. FLAS-F59071]|eukprot:RUS19672.1 hypothetical protein BC937DRAFT_87115 [Endogone sp. FLAS-F59071]
MPSTSLSPENKVTVKRALEKGSNVCNFSPDGGTCPANSTNIVALLKRTQKIYFATLAHLYVAYPNPNQWTYTNIWGAVVFLKDKRINDSFFFRIVDLTVR